MENKKSLTQSILSNIGNKIRNPLEAKKDNNDVKLNLNSFIMVPINHPKANEVIKILNDNKSKANNLETKMIDTSVENNINSEDYKQENSESSVRLIITLNDILNNFGKERIIIPKNSIITPLANDYIKQKKIEVIFTK